MEERREYLTLADKLFAIAEKEHQLSPYHVTIMKDVSAVLSDLANYSGFSSTMESALHYCLLLGRDADEIEQALTVKL